MKKYLCAILITILIPTAIYAEDISVDDLLGNTNNVDVQEVEDQEEERLEEIENELNISIPVYTDNPSHIITFVDPSEDKVGVELDIDESGFKNINSTYSLPSLGIGEHHLKFRFVDAIGATKLLEYDTIIIPRPPIVKAPTFENNFLIISGTGFANSELVVTLSVNASNFTKITEIDSNGNWSTSIDLGSTIDGIYTIFAYTRKDGYASNPSESAVLAYGDKANTTSEDDKDISFSFRDISQDTILNTLAQNPDLIISFIGFLLIGSSISAILITLVRKNNEKVIVKEFSKKINKTKNQKQDKTLLEVFSEQKEKPSKAPKPKKKKRKIFKKKEKKVKKDKKKNSKTISKKDFLKDFKKFDPDTDKGKENREPSKKDKKDIIISLTSKRPD